MQTRCRCSVGNCLGCVCARLGHHCSLRCSCVAENCRNRAEQADIDMADLNEILAALAAGQRQMQAVMANLAARGAAEGAGPPGPIIPAPLPRLRIDRSVQFDGAEESLDSWLEAIQRASELEEWNDDQRRRVAIGTLRGDAVTWHESVGTGIPGWAEWIAALRRTFVPELTEAQWQRKVMERRQRPRESGAQYALSKIRLLRRRPVPMLEGEMIPYLIQGLSRSDHRTVMLVQPPATIATFIAEIQRLEAMSQLGWEEEEDPDGGRREPRPSSSPVRPPLESVGIGSFEGADMDEIRRKMNQMEAELTRLRRSTSVQLEPNRLLPDGQPGFSRGAESGRLERDGISVPRPTVTFDLPSDRPRQDTVSPRLQRSMATWQCYNCHDYGHISRDCPHPRRVQPGNARAGSPGPNRS